jgi:hypothetical protein
LQKADSAGTLVPHFEQKILGPGEDVSYCPGAGDGGAAGPGLAATGLRTGFIPSGVVPAGRLPSYGAAGCGAGVWTTGYLGTPAGSVLRGCSVPGMTFRITWSKEEEAFSLIIRTHASRSFIRFPPAWREKVRIICRISPVFAITESVMIWSRIAFSPGSASLIVTSGISFEGRRFFALSTRMIRLFVRIPSKGIDLT